MQTNTFPTEESLQSQLQMTNDKLVFEGDFGRASTLVPSPAFPGCLAAASFGVMHTTSQVLTASPPLTLALLTNYICTKTRCCL